MAEQPPPRGCVLKLAHPFSGTCDTMQPPPRGCVLKPLQIQQTLPYLVRQPPPRGCVLKLQG